MRCKRDDRMQSAAVAIEKWVHRGLGVWDRVDRFLAPSRYLADRLVEFGIPADRVEHLPNFIEEAPDGGPPGSGWIFAGRLSPEKGVWDLLLAARRLPDHPLTLCGEGPEGEALRRAAPPWVHFLGNVDRAEVANRLRAAAVVAVPSRWPENFPYAVLEAQMAGRAVVASRIGGIPEQIAHDEDGLLVEPAEPVALADAVGALLRAPARAARLGAAARIRVRRDRTPARHLDRLEAIYRSLR